MNICLEGPRGDWDWFEADLREPNLGLDFNKIKSVCKTSNPMVIDIEYDNNEVDLEGILKFNGMGWTSIDALINEAEDLAQYDDDALQKIAMYMRVKSGDLEDAIKNYDNHWTVCTDDPDPTSLAYEMVKDFGISEEDAVNYFDYEALGRDLLIDGYETDETDEYTVGEEYIDGVYGDVANYVAEVGVENIEPYFDFDAYGRNLAFGWSYDDVSGCWMSESVKNKNVNMSKLTESVDLTQSFKDPQGMFGEPGAIVTAQELKDYWDEEYEWDPSLQDFNSFEDWYEDTIEWFEPIIESTNRKLDKRRFVKESNRRFVKESDCINDSCFRDVNGIMGIVDDVWTYDDLYCYWLDEYEFDPVLSEYSTFEDWYADTVANMIPIYNESINNRTTRKRFVKESTSDKKYTGNTWNDFINDIEFNSDYKVDSAYRRRPTEWIELIDGDGNIYDAEVTFYMNSNKLPQTFELMSYNIKPSYQYESIKRTNRKRINKKKCESTNRRFRTRKIVKESTNAIVYTGVDWKDFVHDIESQGIYLVSPSCKNRPCKYIKLIDANTDLCFKGLVQKLPNGGFKLHDGDISANPSSCESIKKKNKNL